jgi:hypothetical protein
VPAVQRGEGRLVTLAGEATQQLAIADRDFRGSRQ